MVHRNSADACSPSFAETKSAAPVNATPGAAFDACGGQRYGNGKPTWPAGLVALLKEWWPDRSASWIAEKTGKTRSSVIGKANRLKLGPKPQSGGRPPRPPRPPPLVVYVEPPPAIIELPFRNLTICEIKSHECHYPHGGEGTAMTFCGQLVEHGSSYCPFHRNLCCHQASARRRDIALDVGHWRGVR